MSATIQLLPLLNRVSQIWHLSLFMAMVTRHNTLKEKMKQLYDKDLLGV